MKIIDKLYVSNLMFKSKRKRLLKIIIFFSFNLILLITVLYFVMAFYGGLTSKINNNKAQLGYIVNYGNSEDVIPISKFDEFSNFKGVTSTQTYTSLFISYYYDRVNNKFANDVDGSILNIDGSLYQTKASCGNSDEFLFYDMEKTDDLITKEEEEYMVSNGYSFGILGNGFSNNPKEIMLSTSLLDSLNLDYYSIIGKNISCKMSLGYYSYGIYLNNESYKDKEGETYQVFSDFKVVGVYNSALIELPNIYDVGSMWFKKSDFYNNPEITYYDGEYVSKSYFEYSSSVEEVSKKANQMGKVFIAPGFNSYQTNLDGRFRQRLSFDSLKNAIKFNKEVNKAASKSAINTYQAYYCTNLLEEYMEKYPYFKVIYSVLLFMFLSTIIASVINIGIVVSDDIKNRKKVIATFEANGMTPKDIWIIGISLTISFVISSIISFVLTFIVNRYYFDVVIDGMLKYHFSYGYYYLSFLLVIVFMIILSFIISFILTYRIKRSKITSLFNSD